MRRKDEGLFGAPRIGTRNVIAGGIFPVGRVLAGMALTLSAPIGAQTAPASTAAERAAVERLRAPAAAGDANAQFDLGQAYRRGRGVAENRVLAESWFRRAAAQGHARAGDNLGLVLFQSGKKTEALPWLEKSAARREPRAQLVLGTMLFNGDTVTRNYPRAYALVLRATAAGLKPAADTLAQMDRYVSPQDRQDGVTLASQMGGAQVAAAPTPAPLPPRPAASAQPASAQPASAQPAPVIQPPTQPAAAPVVGRPAPLALPTPSPTVLPAPTPKPAIVPAATGRYRVQLGAFRDAANARALWSRVGGQVGGTPSYVESGGVTRLQVGPYPTSSDAARACAAAKRAGTDCAVLGG